MLTWLGAASVAIATSVAAQQKPLLTSADYGQFEYLISPTLAPNGRSLAYQISRVDDRAELRVRRLPGPPMAGTGVSAARDTIFSIPWASAARFSRDSRWIAYAVNVSLDERKRLERDKKPIRLQAVVRDLATDSVRVFDGVRTFGIDPASRYVAFLGYAPNEPAGKGADLRVLDLSSGSVLTFGNVAEFAWSDVGSQLAFTVATGTASGNGVQLWEGVTGRLRSLDGSGRTYRQLAWRSHANDLAVLRSTVPATTTMPGARQALLAWRGLGGARVEALQLDSMTSGLSDTLAISEYYKPRWSPDGRLIAVGLRPRPGDSIPRETLRDTMRRASAVPDATEELPTLQLWHTSDVLIVPQQQAQKAARAQRTLLAVWNPSTKRVTQVGTSLSETATLLEGWQYAIERVAEPYRWGAMFGRRYHDVFAVDLATGARVKVVDSVRYSYESGGGRHLLTFDGRDYWAHNLRSGAHHNLTRGLPAAFADTASDTPTDVLPPHGVGGWLDDDRAVLLYDQYDVWRMAPDGTGATRLTHGAASQVSHRVVRLDTARRTYDPTAPLYLALHGDWSQQRGYARLRPGASVERLLLADKWIGNLTRADSADVFAYRAEGRDDSPDIFVAGPTLASPVQATATNPFAEKYAWGRTELIDYRTETGRPLRGVLLYPAHHDPARRYPMIVYAYEKLTNEAHYFQGPNEQVYYDFTTWTQRGYFVLLPDIVFRKRDPGVSLLETLRPAVKSVTARGLVDDQRVGFIGHSWGGYHATYVATHSNLFAASVAGAPLTDFVSFMGQIHWAQGTPEVDHWETGQARMEVPYWIDPEAHHRNSPIHNVHNMTTPLLMAFGNEDGTVDWDQGTEFYNFARRAGKQMVLLVYEGESHAFLKKPNQIDYHRRILEWFGHYLQGEPAPAWITQGVRMDDMPAEIRRMRRR